MNTLNRSLDSLEGLLAEQPIDLPKIQTALRSVREQCKKLNADQLMLIESNQALLQRVAELEKYGKK